MNGARMVTVEFGVPPFDASRATSPELRRHALRAGGSVSTFETCTSLRRDYRAGDESWSVVELSQKAKR